MGHPKVGQDASPTHRDQGLLFPNIAILEDVHLPDCEGQTPSLNNKDGGVSK